MQKYTKLNDLLGKELGRNVYGDPIFQWSWSEEMLWPLTKTGRMITKEREVEIPIIGGGIEIADFGELVPEYAQSRQMRQQNVWVVSKWLSPMDLIFGGSAGHGRGRLADASDETLMTLWNSRFPGADFPSQGWRVPTDATLPRSPYDPREPNYPDTEHFIKCIKDQTSMSMNARLLDMLNAEDEKDKRETESLYPQISDSFNAFLNPKPGSRSSFVSFPWTKHNR